MEGSSSSSQSGNSPTNTAPSNLENNNFLSYKTILYENMSNNRILLKLEEDGFIMPDDKVDELLKNLTKPSYLYTLKLLFENLQNEFSSQVLANSLEALVDTPFNHYSKESVARLELHLRTLVTILERICFSPIVLKEAIDLNHKKPVAYFICGEIYFRQNRYNEAIDNLKKSLEYKAKLTNLYTILGNSYLLRNFLVNDYTTAEENYNIALKNDPNPLNSSAYYLKILTYYTKNDINNVTILFEKYTELLKLLSSDSNSLAKSQLFHLEYLLNKNSSKDLNNILTKINQIPNIKKEVYFISNLTNLNSELCKFQESDVSSLSGLVMCSKNEKLRLDLPIIYNNSAHLLIYKINVKKILSKNCFIKFSIYNDNKYNQSEHMLKHEDVSKLEGLGWIEYQNLRYYTSYSQISIEINSIEMQIDYVRHGDGYTSGITPIPNMSLMGYLLPDYHQFFSNVPETFKDKYFSRKEMENLLDLNDILSIL
ncbi:hypothetical protein GLOIN_2v1836285 [Rhizophagus irregularis DAOM 181602=DAOM 197198]|nr:hypothetical protein GLOIN_2v1836285 [Rhizophagus irregularis DAOM 181602=DAOM 197198]